MNYIEKSQDIPLKAIVSSPIQKKKRTGHIPNSSLCECPDDTLHKRRDSKSPKELSMPYLGVGGRRNEGGTGRS